MLWWFADLYHSEPVGVQVQSPEATQIAEGGGEDLTDGVSGQSQVQQTCHVGKVSPSHRCELRGETQRPWLNPCCCCTQCAAE